MTARFKIKSRRIARIMMIACGVCAFARAATILGQSLQHSQTNLESMAIDANPILQVGAIQELPPMESGAFQDDIAKLGRRLNNLSWQQFEQEISGLWGSKIRASAENPQASVIRFQLPGIRQTPNEMVIDRNQNTVTFEGAMDDAQMWNEMIDIIDSPLSQRNGAVQLIGMGKADASIVRTTALMLGVQEDSSGSLRNAVYNASNRNSIDTNYQWQGLLAANPNPSNGFVTPPPVNSRATGSTAVLRPLGNQETTPEPVIPQQQQPPAIVQVPDETLSGNVKIKIVDEFGTIVLIGAPEDTAKIRAIIENLIKAAEIAQPSVITYALKNADASAVKPIIDDVYQTMYESQNGAINVTALDSRNSLLVIGLPQGQIIAAELIRQLDIESPATPEALDFKVFRLKNMSSVDAAQKLRAYFYTGESPNETVQPETWIASLHGPVAVITDFRSNSLIVKGNAEVIRRAERFLTEVDTNQLDTKNIVRVFSVRNALASDLALVLQNAINGNLEGAPQAFAPGSTNAQFGNEQNVNQQALSRVRAAMLEIVAIDGNNRVSSGVLFDVSVIANAGSNQLIVTGPAESMDLIAELIRQLDVLPDAETQLKVFHMLHGDATEMLTMLQSLFGQSTTGGFNQTQSSTSNFPLQSTGASTSSTLINLRFGVDTGTNSIIVSGPAGDLQVVEDLLYRLDEAPLDNRIVAAYRLKNAPAEDLAAAINDWLDSRQEIIDADPTTLNAYTSARRQVIVVPDIVTNSLIINATPEYYQEVMQLIEVLDKRPPMVKVKVLIAEVTLTDLTEFGVEFGIQDSLLFDRGVGVVGFPFNTATLGNNNNALSLGTRENVAAQGLSNLNIGRSNSNLGYGGLVLSAGNESINVLMRALEDRGLVRVLSSPNIMSLENLQGRIQVGANVPRITSATNNGTNAGGLTTNVEDVAVGVILEITARVSPDGMIVMNVDAVNSSLGSEADGVPVFVSEGQVIRSPQINITQAQTTIMARSGQTVTFSGLIQDATTREHRGTPILSDLPVIGPLFSYESEIHARKELLIVLTPYLVESDEQIEASNQTEMDRMHWCLADVAEIYGPVGYGEFDPQNIGKGVPTTFYPDQDPSGSNPIHLPLESGSPGDESESIHSPPQDPQSNGQPIITPTQFPPNGFGANSYPTMDSQKFSHLNQSPSQPLQRLASLPPELRGKTDSRVIVDSDVVHAAGESSDNARTPAGTYQR